MRKRLIFFGLAMLTVAVTLGVGRLVRGDDGPDVAEVARGVQTLQPAADDTRAAELAEIFHKAARDHRHDPLLLVAISFRESSLKRDVEERRRRGALGEWGLMQCHGAALSVRPADCNHHLVGARCQVQTGAAWLAYARAQCGGSWWRWVAAYGMSACPSEAMARRDAAARVARRHYDRIGGRRWR